MCDVVLLAETSVWGLMPQVAGALAVFVAFVAGMALMIHKGARLACLLVLSVPLFLGAMTVGGMISGLIAGYVGSRAPGADRAASVPNDPSTQPISLEVAADATDAEEQERAEGPDWIDAAPGKVDEGYQVVVSVGPYTTRMECDQALPAQLQAAAAEYAQLYLGAEAEGRASLGDAFLLEHVVKEQWEETKTTSVGPMVVLHARAVFDTKANDQLKQNWREAVVADRLWLTGWGVGAILVVLIGVLVWLKQGKAL